MTDDSSPCFAHLLAAGQPVDPETHRDVARFRKAERARLMAARRALPADQLRKQSNIVAEALETLIPSRGGQTLALYWPIRGELDLRPWMTAAHEQGAQIALPVVVKKDAPVAFHRWEPGCAMTRGVWNIPVPQSAEPLTPDVVIAPLLGIDAAGYRLGNGGGYYDRTLAALPRLPQVIGVGHDFCRMDTIFPMPWDVPMQQSILGDGSLMDHGA
ncbi:5-formyltetrahydrofolate cyclo-ligase [Sulfitobacter sp. PS-8MA]|uniref:5-formyltetrahydrofolate cyclo-ligase n=1 Tax=Sulfitobacter sp. PS-8MA TaxID=3237707 RepID=UPI0034C6513A